MKRWKRGLPLCCSRRYREVRNIFFCCSFIRGWFPFHLPPASFHSITLHQNKQRKLFIICNSPPRNKYLSSMKPLKPFSLPPAFFIFANKCTNKQTKYFPFNFPRAPFLHITDGKCLPSSLNTCPTPPKQTYRQTDRQTKNKQNTTKN